MVLELQEVVVAYRQVVGAAFHQLAEAVAVALHRVVEVALLHREGAAYRQVAVAAFHQLAEVVALHRVAVVFLDQAAAQLQN